MTPIFHSSILLVELCLRPFAPTTIFLFQIDLPRFPQ
jgi:hypothetical protein